MNTKTIVMTSALALGTLGVFYSTQHQEVTQAAEISKAPENFTLESGGQELEIYSDPGLTQKTGRKLDSNTTNWKVFNMSFSDDSVGLPQYDNLHGGLITYDLGGGQWVQGTSITSDLDCWNVAEIFTQGGNVPVYSDSALTHQIGTLNNGIHDWKVSRLLMMANGFYAADVGHNQWIKIDNVGGTGPHLMRKAVIIEENTTLYDGSGYSTGKVPETDVYRLFEFKILSNGHYYGRVGSNSQWVDMRNTLIN